MTLNEVTIDQFFQMEEEEKIKFYRKILDDTPKSQPNTQYRTALKVAPQAKVPQFKFHQENGKLTFIAPLKRTDRNITSLFFLCVCDCGKWIILEANSFRREKQIRCADCSNKSGVHILNISGEIFGQLKALYPTEKRGSDGSVYWQCECIDCGHLQEVNARNLKKGHLCAVCGEKSKGEYLVGKILDENNIFFEREKIFDNCRFPNTLAPAKFDFYVNNQYIIEVDGEHHFYPSRYGNSISKEKAEENLIKTQNRDRIKNEYCFKNNIPILRIPYFYFENKELTLKDLKPETSQFLLTDKGMSATFEE